MIAADELVVLDFDRMLADPDAAMRRFYQVANRYGIDNSKVQQAKESTENDGGSFAPIKFLRAALDVRRMEQFVSDFVASDGPDILYDDAYRFLRLLEENSAKFMVLTYGADPLWQEMKVRASGYNGPMRVVSHSDKGSEIASWKSEGKKYVFKEGEVELSAPVVCLLDDKAVAFKNLPEDCRGFCVQRTRDLLPSQAGSLPPGIAVVRSLDELTLTEGLITRIRE